MKNHLLKLEKILSANIRKKYMSQLAKAIHEEGPVDGPVDSLSYFAGIISNKRIEVKQSINEEVFNITTEELKKNYAFDILNLIKPLMDKCLNRAEGWDKNFKDERNLSLALYYNLETLKLELENDYEKYLKPENMKKESIETPLPGKKLKLLLSVPQIAFLFKTLNQVKIISGEEIDIKKFIITNISSKEQTDIAGNSFKKKWSDKELVNLSEKELRDLSDKLMGIHNSIQSILSKKNPTQHKKVNSSQQL